MRCPTCDSPDVVRLPPNNITPHPGYRCNGCGRRLRGPGMFAVYAVTLVLGLGVAALTAWGLAQGEADREIRIAWLGGVGLVVAGYSVWQLLRPAPRPDPPADPE